MKLRSETARTLGALADAQDWLSTSEIGSINNCTQRNSYKAMCRLEAAEFIESTLCPAGIGRRRLYRITPSGRKALEAYRSNVKVPKVKRPIVKKTTPNSVFDLARSMF